jgi:hypothetical protein
LTSLEWDCRSQFEHPGSTARSAEPQGISFASRPKRPGWTASRRLVSSAVLFAALSLLGCVRSCSHPTDATLLAEFDKNEAKFDELLRMFTADQGIGGVKPRTPAPAMVSAERWQSYLVLMSDLDVRYGVVRPKSGCEMGLSMSAGWLLDASYKGIVYCSVPPATLRESLDGRPQDLAEGVVAYRRIRGNWYIYYWWSSG